VQTAKQTLLLAHLPVSKQLQSLNMTQACWFLTCISSNGKP
jgi:hypothetical protein